MDKKGDVRRASALSGAAARCMLRKGGVGALSFPCRGGRASSAGDSHVRLRGGQRGGGTGLFRSESGSARLPTGARFRRCDASSGCASAHGAGECGQAGLSALRRRGVCLRDAADGTRCGESAECGRQAFRTARRARYGISCTGRSRLRHPSPRALCSGDDGGGWPDRTPVQHGTHGAFSAEVCRTRRDDVRAG